MFKLKLNNLILGSLHSYTVVFFSKNTTFAVILLLVSFFDLYTGVAGLSAVLIANLLSFALGLNEEKIKSGFYGFNALLVGLGLGIAIQPSVVFYIVLFVAILLTILITLFTEGVIGKYALPYLTFPFLITIWITILAIRSYNVLIPSESGIFMLNTMFSRGGKLFVDLYNTFNQLQWPLIVTTYFKSLSAIIFQYHLFAGILLAAGLLIYSRIAFIFSIIGFTTAWGFYDLMGANMHDLDYSFIGFNHILTAIGIGSFYSIPSRWSVIWVLLITPVVSILISAFNQLFVVFQLPIFSLPFNLAVILFLYAMKFRERMINKPQMVIYQQFSPEKNLYSASTYRKRFVNQSYIPISLPFFGVRYISQAHDGDITHKDEWKHAWDFVIRNDEGLEYESDGSHVNDYYCYNKPVLAPAEGWVQEVVDHIEDNEPGKYNLNQNWGNTIIIKHTDLLYSKVSHLKKDSALVSKGMYVYRGQVLGYVGNSGRSPFPHLHFQLQAYPFVGSKTINYPIAQYISHNSKPQLHLYEVPHKDELVENIQSDKSLKKAFTFIPGQTIKFKSNNSSTGTWEVGTDIYNNIYIYCKNTKSTAWLKTDDNLFYFSHFDGDKKSELFLFFLSAYQISLGYYKDLRIRDIFPPTVLRKSPVLLLQDFVAPFAIFIEPKYEMIFKDLQEDIAGNTITIETTVSSNLPSYIFKEIKSTMIIDIEGIKRLTVQRSKSLTEITFITA